MSRALRWLVVSPYLPHSRVGHGGGISVFHLCRELARTHSVTLLCFRREGEEGLERELEAEGVSVECVDFRSERDRGIAKLALLGDRLGCLVRSRISHRPLMVEKYDRDEMHARLENCIREHRPEVIQVEYGFLAPYASRARFFVDARWGVWQNSAEWSGSERPHVLLNTHESGTLVRLRRLSAAPRGVARWRLGRELGRWASHERDATGSADTVLCVTEQDRSLLHALSGAENLRTLPLGVDVEGLPTVSHEPQNPPHLLFVGSFGHPPNLRAARVLVEELMPRLRQEREDIVLDIVGRGAPEWLRDRASQPSSGVKVHGFVEELDPLFESARIFVAPLFSGGGIKIKILEAMGRGCAVVTTPTGAEGIDEEGTALALGRSVDELARHILRLVDDLEARRTLGSAARRRMQERFGWGAIVRALARTVEENPTS